MRFESRDLKPYAEPVVPGELQEGSVYFFLAFEDDELLLPSLQPVVFIGRDLEPGDCRRAYFQNFPSYRDGARYPFEDSDSTTCRSHSPQM